MRKGHLYKLSAISFKFKNLQKDCTELVSWHVRVTSTNCGVTRQTNQLHNQCDTDFFFLATSVTTTLSVLYAGFMLRFYAIWRFVLLLSFLSFLALFVLGGPSVSSLFREKYIWGWAWSRLGYLFVDCLLEGSMVGRHLKFPRPGFPYWVPRCHSRPLPSFSLFTSVFWFRNLHACFPVSSPIAGRIETCAFSPRVRNWLKRSLCWGELRKD